MIYYCVSENVFVEPEDAEVGHRARGCRVISEAAVGAIARGWFDAEPAIRPTAAREVKKPADQSVNYLAHCLQCGAALRVSTHREDAILARDHHDRERHDGNWAASVYRITLANHKGA